MSTSWLKVGVQAGGSDDVVQESNQQQSRSNKTKFKTNQEQSRSNQRKFKVPQATKDALIEFTMNYLLEQPRNFTAFAKKHFRIEQQRRVTHRIFETNESYSYMNDDGVSLIDPVFFVPPTCSMERRPSVFGDTYDPITMGSSDYIKPHYEKTDQELSILKNVALQILLFRALDEEQLQDVLNAMLRRYVNEGDVIITQGDAGDNFYVIEDGCYDVFIKKGDESKLVHSYKNEGSFGELALLYNQPRAATVIATTDGVVWALDRKTFRMLVLQSAYDKRQKHEELIKKVPLLETLGSYERLNLADVLISKHFFAGEVIIRQGDKPEGMYFIESGTVVVKMKMSAGEEVELCKFGPGGYFGEFELVINAPILATVYAETDVKLAFLELDAFERFMGPCIDLMKRNVASYMSQVRNVIGSESDLPTHESSQERIQI